MKCYTFFKVIVVAMVHNSQGSCRVRLVYKENDKCVVIEINKC